jgi:large conductance mechanosensitive channel
MGFFQEFREFAMKGNVVDMAVGVIIGGAFGKIVASMVDDVLMPPLGMAIGGVNFKDLAIELKAATESSPAVLLAYGKFLQTVLDFGILALVIFLLVRAMNKLRQEEPAAPPAPPEPSAEERLLTEIRDLLRARA